MEDKLTIIIPAAGLGRRMKSYGPKSLISLGNGQLLLSRQLDILHKLYPKAEIVVVLGFDADKVYKILPPYVRTVENEFYDETNVVRSIALGLRASNGNNSKLLLVYGDLVFNSKTFEALNLDTSQIIIDNNGQILEGEVGLTVNNHYVTYFAYGLPTKWTHIALLTGRELQLFKQLVGNKNFKKHYGFEIMNMLLEQGCKLKAIEPTAMAITEIDTSKDIERAHTMLKKETK